MPEWDDNAQAWRRLAERTIGRSLDSLRSRSSDGLGLEPLHTRATSDVGQPWPSEAAWSVAQRVDHPDPEAANQLALLDLEGGANALALVGDASPWSRGFGLALATCDLDLVLAEVDLDFLRLRLDAGAETAGALTALAALVERRRLTSAALEVDIGADPIGVGARLGRDFEDETARLLDLRAKAGLAGTVFLADGRPWHEAGAGEAQELAAVLAAAVAYLRRLEARGVPPDQGRSLIAVLLAMDANVLLGLAKVRAMRRLWARIETACGLETAPLRLHAETSWRMMTRHDPSTNVMRATAATFAAGLGGADIITVLPYTLALGLPDEAARRLARNVQRVLLDESHLAKVADPAAGSGAFESLTDALCREAWRLFQEVEREGGLPRALPILTQKMDATARIRSGEVANLTHGIIGTSRFASLDAPPPKVSDVKPRRPNDADRDALPSRRDAEPFEALRDRAEALATKGRRPTVFLATLGTPAEFGPRATEAANFFAAAGIEAVIASEPGEIEALLKSIAASRTRVACLCGTDTVYRAAEGLVADLRANGAQLVLRVGTPAADDPDSGSVDAVIHDGCDALAILDRTLHALRPEP